MNRKANTQTGKRILLVEDEQVARETLRRLFEQDSHTVIEANNGAEALTLFRTGKFDLVIVDLKLPFIKGNELAVRIKQVAPKQPILMVTAFAQQRSADNPVDMIVNKPFSAGRLREMVTRLISSAGDHAVSKSEPVERCPAL